MAAKKAFALRIDQEMMEAIEKWAADDFRSANAQIEWILARVLKEKGRYPKSDGKKKDKKSGK